MSSPQRDIARLREQIGKMQRLAEEPESQLFRSVAVSAWCTTEHLDHAVKVSKSVLHRIIAADTASPLLTRITPVGRVVLLLGRIPRGRGKAPERLRGERVGGPLLQNALKEVDALIEQLDIRLLSSRVPIVSHAQFGGLTPSQAIRFVIVHNAHHLRIIKDIGRCE